jgi:hypothetical protein
MLMLVAASVASAQARRQASSTAKVWELGVDASLAFGLDDPGFTLLQIPTGSFRAGVHVSDVLSIEPFFSYNYLKIEDLDGDSFYTFGVGGLYHFSTDRARSQLYVRPFLMLVGDGNDSELGGGVGVGMKWPRLGGRMAWRGEANVSSVNDQTQLGALFGISFFTR